MKLRCPHLLREAEEIELECSMQVFLAVLRFLYTDSLSASEDILDSLYIFAKQVSLRRLTDLCELEMSSLLDLDNFGDVWEFSSQNGAGILTNNPQLADALKSKVIQFVFERSLDESQVPLPLQCYVEKKKEILFRIKD